MFPTPDIPSKFDPDTYWDRVGAWLQEAADAIMRRTPTADFDTLVDTLHALVKAATNDNPSYYAGRYGMTSAGLDERIREKATWTLAHHRPAVPRGPFKGRFTRPFTMAERARGGKASTKAAYMQKRLQALQALPEGLTPEEQAEELDCSMSTLWRLRKRLREQQATQEDPDLQILAQMDEEIATFPEMTAEGVPTESDARITVMTEPETPIIVPDHVPASWIDNIDHVIAEENARQAASITFDSFAGIEVEL